MSWSVVRPAHLMVAAAIVVGAILVARFAWPAAAAGGAYTPASNVAVNCEIGQQALVRQTVVRGEPHVAIQCASGAMAQQAAYAGELAGRSAAVTSEPRLIPANYVVPADPAPRQTVRATSPSTRAAAPVRPVDKRRSWKNTALVIGGSAGAGAAIGAIAGGKKGALIGAAIGGGGAGLYEAIKR